MHDVAQLLYREFDIKELTIGVKSPQDGLFRYVAFAGLRKTSEDAFRRLEYTKEEFFDPKKYPGAMISKNTKLFLAEDNPYAEGEEETYNRPLMLSQKRRSLDESIEGDYLDIHAFDSKNEVIGWIEISGTKKGRLPDAMTIRWLETIASAVGVAILVDRFRRAPRRGPS